MTVPTRRGPVVAEVQVRRPPTKDDTAWLATTTVRIDADEPVFAGHYPGFPIFPGVCVVECVHRSARATAPQPIGGLEHVESARFLGAVYPGDELVIELAWTERGNEWLCRATVATGQRDVAILRLNYGAGGQT